jgi:hypothetical protein
MQAPKVQKVPDVHSSSSVVQLEKHDKQLSLPGSVKIQAGSKQSGGVHEWHALHSPLSPKWKSQKRPSRQSAFDLQSELRCCLFDSYNIGSLRREKWVSPFKACTNPPKERAKISNTTRIMAQLLSRLLVVYRYHGLLHNSKIIPTMGMAGQPLYLNYYLIINSLVVHKKKWCENYDMRWKVSWWILRDDDDACRMQDAHNIMCTIHFLPVPDFM